MPENYYLTPNEQLVIEPAEGMDIIFTEDMIKALQGMNPQSVKNALSSLARKGRIFRVKRGIYLSCEAPHKPVIGDPARLALTVFNGYIAFSSALHHWNLIEYEPFTIFVATRNKSGTREVGEYTFRAVSMGMRAQGMVYNRDIYVSSLEKTIFDCLYKPINAGGNNLVAKAIGESKPDWKEVAYWFNLLGSKSLKQRGGYVLSKAGNAPNWLLERLRHDAVQKIWLDPSARRKGMYVKEWRIIDNVGGWDGNR